MTKVKRYAKCSIILSFQAIQKTLAATDKILAIFDWIKRNYF